MRLSSFFFSFCLNPNPIPDRSSFLSPILLYPPLLQNHDPDPVIQLDDGSLRRDQNSGHDDTGIVRGRRMLRPYGGKQGALDRVNQGVRLAGV